MHVNASQIIRLDMIYQALHPQERASSENNFHCCVIVSSEAFSRNRVRK